MLNVRFGSMARILALAVFGGWCWQVFWWQRHAVEVTWLQLRTIVGVASVDERMTLGLICRWKRHYACAARIFTQLAKDHPNLVAAQVHRAISEAEVGRCAEALVEMEALRSELAENVALRTWQGRCLLKLGRREAARTSLYQAVQIDSGYAPAVEELVDLLFSDNLVEEALSVLGSLTNGNPARSPEWRTKFAELNLRLTWQVAQIGEATPNRRAVRVVSLDGQKFWIPIRFAPDRPPEFALIDLESPGIWLSEDQLLEIPFHQVNPADATNSDRRLDVLQVGPWLLRDVNFRVCRDCASRLGRLVLEKFEVTEGNEAGLLFLSLTPL